MTKPFAQDADAQSLGRLAERAHVVAGARRNRPRVPAVVAGDHREQPGDVFDGRAHRTAMIDGIADRHRARGRHQSPGRLQAVDAAPARGRADRSALVAAERHRHLARRHQRRTAARRAAGAVRRVMRIADDAAGAGMACSGKAEIFAGRLARDGAAGVENARHHGGVDLRHITFEQRRTVHHGNAGDADVVLDRDLLAAQQSLRAAMDVRLPVPAAIGIFRRGRTVSRRSRRNRRQRRRDQFVKPAIRRERALESLLKSRDLVGVEHKTEIGSELFDLLQCRKPDCHAHLLLLSLRRRTKSGRQTKKATRDPKRSRMASTPLLSMVV